MERDPQGAADVVPDLAVLSSLGEHSPPSSRYRLKGEIAHGGMGSILLVWDADLRRRLAMKVIHGGGGADDAAAPPVPAKALRRFLHEAQVTAQLEHPGIVPVHELGIDGEGRVYFTMRLVKGEVLTRIIEKVHRGEQSGWSLTRALHVLLRVCEAMAYAHAKEVIHRDLKPDNVMVGEFGETYVMDWGLARVLHHPPDDALDGEPGNDGSGSALLTRDGDVIGTPAYMAPEQREGALDRVGPWSDVYSLGAMLYHLLTGRVPYAGVGLASDPLSVLGRAQDGPPRPIRDLAPAAPAELVAICDKAMAAHPSRRYRSVRELGDDLRAWLERRVVHAYESGAMAEMRKWVGRNRVLAATLAAAVFLTSFFVVRLGQENKVARASEVRADREAKEATLARDRVLRLADVKRLADLEAETERLWPARPERIGELDAWLARAAELEARLPEHRALLESLRAGGAHADGGFVFADTETQWWHDTLARLVAGLEEFAGPDRFGATIASVRARREFAAALAWRSIEGERAAWDEAIAAIADPRRAPLYRGCTIAPQLGLVPLGLDPRSGLYEFWHVGSGDRPARTPAGSIALGGDDGIVFVLVPGGTYRVGTAADDPRPHEPEESPAQDVELAPFFLAKFEMTQGQWLRATGENPSAYPAGVRFGGKEITLAHPVEHVSWQRSTEVLARLGLALPTEAQWEAACRAGSATQWWAGDSVADLAGAGNLADRFCREHGGPASWTYDDALDDGYVVHAPVGSFRPNAFGFHDVVGNVWEWCRDGLSDYALPVHPGDGAREDGSPRNRVFRGGAFSITAYHARSANRSGYTEEYRFNSLGLRPALALARVER